MARIIVPLDGSDVGERCLKCLDFLKGTDVTLELLRVIEPGDDTSREDVERYLASKAKNLARTLGTEVLTRVSHGLPYLAILEEAQSQDVLMLAMSTHGRAGARQHGIGSVTDKVTRLAPCPVLIVGQSCSPRTAGIDAIIVAADGSRLGEEALPAALLLARIIRKPLVLLTIVAGELDAASPLDRQAIAQRESEASAYLAGIQRQFPPSVKATALVRRGPVTEALVQEVRRYRNVLVVMSSHGAEGFRSYRVGRVTDDLLIDCPAPILLVEPGQAQHMLRAMAA